MFFNKTKPWIAVAVAAFLILAVLSYVAFSGGIRGSDQFWYLMDTESAIRGEFTSPIYYPCLLRNGVEGMTPQPFIHNVTSIYAAAFLGSLTSPYLGWIILNTASVLLSSILLFLIFRRVISTWLSVAFASVYAILPLTFWSMSQVLSEASTSLMVVVLLYLFFNFKDTFPKWLLMAMVSIVLASNVTTFLPLIILIPVVMICKPNHTTPKWRTFIYASVIFLISGIGYYTITKLLPSYKTGGSLLYNISMVAVPGNSDNMSSFFTAVKEIPEKTVFFANVIKKAWHNLYIQFVPKSLNEIVFNLTFNLFAIVSVCGLWKANKNDKKYIYTGLLFLLLFVITICAFQNQSRYAMMLMPPIYISFAVSASRIIERFSLEKIAAILLVCAVIGFSAVDFVLADYTRKDGIKSKVMVEQMQEACEQYIPPEATILDIGELSSIASYAINRPFMKGSAAPKYYMQFFEYLMPDYVIMSENTGYNPVLEKFETVHDFDVGDIKYKILKVKA